MNWKFHIFFLFLIVVLTAYSGSVRVMGEAGMGCVEDYIVFTMHMHENQPMGRYEEVVHYGSMVHCERHRLVVE